MDRPELRRANSKIDQVDPILYVADHTAASMGLHASDMVHPDFHSAYVFIEGKKQISDLRAIQEEFKAKRRTDDARNRPVVSVAADQTTPVLVAADDAMEAEELQDLLGEKFEKDEAKLRKQKALQDFDWIRYVNGRPIGRERIEMTHDAFEKRIDQHKQNSISDPARDPWKDAKEKGLVPDNLSIAVPEIKKEETNV